MCANSGGTVLTASGRGKECSSISVLGGLEEEEEAWLSPLASRGESPPPLEGGGEPSWEGVGLGG